MKIFMAGYETIYNSYKYEAIDKANLFLSFYYKNNIKKTADFIKSKNYTTVIDSGAHSFFAHKGISATPHIKVKGNQKDPDSYFSDYLSFIKQYYNYFSYFVELDIQDIVGKDKVEKWRNEYRKLGIADKIIKVHHSINTRSEFEDLVKCSESRYIGIEGFRQNLPKLKYNSFIKYCYENKCKIHGFAMIKINVLRQLPFYSVDSSRISSSYRYGTIDKFINGKLIIAKTKEGFIKNNISPELYSSFRGKEDNKKKLLYCETELKKLETYYTKYWQARGIVWEN